MTVRIPRRWPDLSRERRLLRAGATRIAGLDEAGRGAWAGPLAAAAVILPLERRDLARALLQVRDSKQMTPRQRSEASALIRDQSLAWAVGAASAQEVDSLGPLRATHLAMRRAIAELTIVPDHLLIDYLRLPELVLPQTPVVHGDAASLSIAAASVLAKVWRDIYMRELAGRFPYFGFDRHKGYGTAEHAAALRRMGPCPEHRLSYAPVQHCRTTFTA